jgi:hypothetical protein
VVLIALCLIFVAVGTWMSILAIRHLLRRRMFLRESEVSAGVVVGLAESPDEEGTSYSPIVRFRTEDWREATFQSEMGSSDASWQVGDTIRVRHRRDRPNVAEVDSFAALWGPTVFLAVLGVAFLSIGIGILIGWLPVTATAPR